MLRRFLTTSLPRATSSPLTSASPQTLTLTAASKCPPSSPTSTSPRRPPPLPLLLPRRRPSFSSSPLTPPPPPLILVVSGSSGVGKDSLISSLRLRNPSLHFVVTAPSRPIRPGELHGRHYLFLTKPQFLAMIDAGELLEYALVYDDYKGIPKQQIRDAFAKGCDVVLRVDVQGAETLRRILGDGAVFVFLVAESEEKLVERLVDRKTETKESLMVRVATAREEVKRVERFDYVVVNKEGRLEEAVELVDSIVMAEKARVKPRRSVI